MCTKAEVREVFKETAMPQFTKVVLAASLMGILSILSWMTLSINAQSEILLTTESEAILRDSKLSGRMDSLILEISNIKTMSVTRMSDNYTGTQALARNDLIDERCKVVNTDLATIKAEHILIRQLVFRLESADRDRDNK